MSTISLKSLMGDNFIGYASYVIKERAIPHIDDGLKPVQRRILHTLNEVDDGKYHKVANIVGHTMRYHPHGDASIGDALVNIAQKNYFIDQQGNFGNILTGDPASAARYIECRLSPLARETLFNQEVTEYVDSYDGRNKEPICLPAKIPSLLMLGTEGIAVGLSTKICPHNFVELLEAQIKILKGEDFEIFPDFSQAGLMDVTDYQRGKGKLKLRAKVEVTDNKTLVVREIPYGTTTESIIASIENAITRGKLKISSINDFTTDKVEIELKIGHGATAQDILPRLFLYTDCETSLSSNIVVIKDNMPLEADVNEILTHNTNKLVFILESELKSDLFKLKEKLQEKLLTKVFIQNKIYQKVEEIDNYDEIEQTILMQLEPFKSEFIREVNASDIDKLLSMPIKRISRFDMNKTIEEIAHINHEIDIKQDNLNNINAFSIKYLKDLIKKYGKGHERKTQIEMFESIDITKVAVQDLKVAFDKKNGYLGTEIKSTEFLQCSSFDKILMFFKNGDYKIINIPEKLFIEDKLISFDRQSSQKPISVVYMDLVTGLYYMKRFVIKQFILDKVYRFIPEGAKLVYFSEDDRPVIQVDYALQKRSKVTTEYFHLGRLLIKSVHSIGNQVSTKPITKVSQAKVSIAKLFESQPDDVVKLKPPAEEQPTLFETLDEETKVEENS
jgi:topoisomerase-4 subunit A